MSMEFSAFVAMSSKSLNVCLSLLVPQNCILIFNFGYGFAFTSLQEN